MSQKQLAGGALGLANRSARLECTWLKLLVTAIRKQPTLNTPECSRWVLSKHVPMRSKQHD